MSDTRFHSIFPYLVSPVQKNGKINTAVLSQLCEDLINSGVHGLTPLGSPGEFAYMNWQQRKQVVETVISVTANRVPVIAGVASTTTADAQFQAKEFERMGCHGILAILETYFPVSQDGIFSYFKAIAEAVSVPVILYTNPNFQRSDLTIPLI